MAEPTTRRAVVDHRGLAGRDALGRVEQLDLDRPSPADRRPERAVLGCRGRAAARSPSNDWSARGGAAPARPVGGDPVDGQRLARADGDGARDRARCRARSAACRPGPGVPSRRPLRWPMVKPKVPSCRPSSRPDSASTIAPPWLGAPVAELLAQPAGVVAVGDEADVVGVGLLGDQQAARGRLRAHLRLGGVAEREQRVGQLLLGEHAEHVGLVLAAVDRPMELDRARRRRCAAGRSGRSRRRRSRAPAPGRARRRT